MSMPPRYVAISQRVVDVSGRGETRDCLDQAWTTWLEALDLVPIPVPNRLDSVLEFLIGVKPVGVVLSGGNNLTLPVYNEPVAAPDAFESRDATERELVDFARREHIPLLACCRGMQFLNAYFGGRLSSLRASTVTHVASEHAILLANPMFEQLAGRNSITVNSFHDFGLTAGDLAPPLLAWAVAPGDGSVEGVVHHAEPIVGIMWHPERRNPAAGFDQVLARRLFDARGFRRQLETAAAATPLA